MAGLSFYSPGVTYLAQPVVVMHGCLSRSLAHRISVIQIYRALDYTQTNKVSVFMESHMITQHFKLMPPGRPPSPSPSRPGRTVLCNSVLSREDTQEAVLIPIEYKEWITDQTL